MPRILLLIAVLLMASVKFPARAGEISGTLGSCELSSVLLSSCDWKPKACFKPDPPITAVYDVDSYNRAVDEYNAYLSEVGAYKACVVGEAKNDIDSAANVIVAGAKKTVSEVDEDAESAKSQLELSKPR